MRATADDIRIRLLTHADLEGGVETLVRAFNEFSASVGLPATFNTFSQARSTLQMALQLDRQNVWGAVWNERKVVGVAVAYRRGGYVSVGPVAVHPMVQGRGVGRKLMRSLAQANADAGCMALVHAGTNPHAFTLYRTEGFRVVYPEATFVGEPERQLPYPDGVTQARRADLDAIASMDRALTGVDRSQELELLLGLGGALRSERGYLIHVRLGDSLALGPAACEDAETMRDLIAAALDDVPPGGIMVRAPANGAAFDVCVDAGLVPESVGNLMATGRWPDRRGEHLHPIFPEVL